MPLSLSPADLGAISGSTLSSFQVRDDVQIVKQYEPELPKVMVDGEQLRRVFANLALNAQEAMPEGGELTIITRRVDGTVHVAFRDTGTGISDEYMKKPFEPLFSTKIKRSGLGLTVCQQIVTKRGGTIDAVGQDGEGATFTVNLPLNSEENGVAERKWEG